MAVQTQALAADASRLSQLLHQEMDRLESTRTLLMYMMVGLFGVFLLASYLLTYRRILTSIATLRAGAAVIGSGNLDFAIEEKTNDEIGELSHAFNRMTTDLKAVTASKGDLEREIDERKRVEAEMQKLAEQHQLALDAARMGWWHYDPITRIASWDGRFIEIFGVTGYSRPEDEILARLHPEDLPGVWAKAEAALGPVSPHVFSAEYRINLPGGSMKWIETHGIASFEGVGENRRVRSFVGTVQDITERKRTEATLTEHAAKLEEINKELESFSYSVSHDLRAPLRAIAGFSQMILKKEGERFDEETRRRFQVISDNAETMGRLIDDLLAFSRLGRQAIAKRGLDMEELIGEVWEELVTINPGRELNLKIGRMPAASGDRTLIRQVYSNLLENAVKFTRGRDAAVIEAGSYVKDNEPVYYVRDNGVGFDMKFYDKLFGVFQRLHTDEEYKGTGIGLALVQRIVHRHGGRVWAEGAVDEGACFYFSLPEKS